jgi:hypothetical protein
MEIKYPEDAEVFRYKTKSGFRVETFNNVMPVFDADEKSVSWYNFAPSPSELFRISLQLAAEAPFSEVMTAWYNEGPNLIQLDSSAYPSLESIFCEPAYCVGTVVEDGIQISRQCLGSRDNRIVDQKHGSSLLLAGQEYLVSRNEQERTKAAAKDHVTHLELMTLSRDHSRSNLFSTAVRKLKRFGWGVWRNYWNSSNRGSNCSARVIRSGQSCPSFAIAFIPLI